MYQGTRDEGQEYKIKDSKHHVIFRKEKEILPFLNHIPAVFQI